MGKVDTHSLLDREHQGTIELLHAKTACKVRTSSETSPDPGKELSGTDDRAWKHICGYGKGDGRNLKRRNNERYRYVLPLMIIYKISLRPQSVTVHDPPAGGGGLVMG